MYASTKRSTKCLQIFEEINQQQIFKYTSSDTWNWSNSSHNIKVSYSLLGIYHYINSPWRDK